MVVYVTSVNPFCFDHRRGEFVVQLVTVIYYFFFSHIAPEKTKNFAIGFSKPYYTVSYIMSLVFLLNIYYKFLKMYVTVLFFCEDF